MSGKFIYQRSTIVAILILQFIPLIMFPPSAFSLTSQELWLPFVLAIFALVAIIQLIARKSTASWPWYMVGFAQGFNIISRLMMLMPHATLKENGTQIFNTPYVLLTVISVIISWLILDYIEKPEVRMNLLRS
jgi:bacteriorhodopsin